MTRYRAFRPTDPAYGTIDDLALVEDTERSNEIVAQHEGPDALDHAEETARALDRTTTTILAALTKEWGIPPLTLPPSPAIAP